jgi:hypothetical protein
MRRKFHPQRSLFHVMPRSQIGRELDEVSKILDAGSSPGGQEASAHHPERTERRSAHPGLLNLPRFGGHTEKPV